MKRETKMSPIKMQLFFQILVKFKRSSKTFYTSPSTSSRSKGTKWKVPSSKIKSARNLNCDQLTAQFPTVNDCTLERSKWINRQVQIAACGVLNPKSNLSIKGKKLIKKTLLPHGSIKHVELIFFFLIV
jgi:hypothetical protein